MARLGGIAPQVSRSIFHLAGFGPECLRKAFITHGNLMKALGHDLSDTAVLEFVLTLSTNLQRYPEARGWQNLADWSPEVRYKATGTYSERAEDAVHEAERVMFDLLAVAWADGLLPANWEAC